MSNTTKKSLEQNKARLAALKKLGLAPSVKIPRKKEETFSKSDRDKISKAWSKYSGIANADKGEFVKKNIKNYTENDRKKLKQSGYVVAGDNVFLPTHGYDSASIKTVWTKDKSGKHVKTLEVVRKAGNRKEETEYIGTRREKMEWRDRLISQYEQGKFKEGDYIGIKVFDNGIFEREIVTSLDKLFQYISQVAWHDRDAQKMLDNLHLVKISIKSGDIRDIAANNKTNKQVNHSNYIRKKNRKATGTKKLSGRVKRN